MARVYIGIGGNLGDREGHIAFARRSLEMMPATRLAAFSTVHETDPLGPAGQGKYLNAAAALDTTLEPLDLLAQLRKIEQEAGRERRTRWDARTLDLDLLLYDGLVMDTDELTLPHPRMHERRFVLEPLAEIAPHAVHPLLGKTVEQLLRLL